jgi:hypothetical protein
MSLKDRWENIKDIWNKDHVIVEETRGSLPTEGDNDRRGGWQKVETDDDAIVYQRVIRDVRKTGKK